MLSDQEIIRMVQTIRRSSQTDRQAGRIATMSGLARAAGITRMQLHRIASGEPIGAKARAALTNVLGCNEQSGVRTRGP